MLQFRLKTKIKNYGDFNRLATFNVNEMGLARILIYGVGDLFRNNFKGLRRKEGQGLKSPKDYPNS